MVPTDVNKNTSQNSTQPAQPTENNHPSQKVDNNKNSTIPSPVATSENPTTHFLIKNKCDKHGKVRDIECYVCMLTRCKPSKTRTRFSCIQCEKAFHVNCFTLYHHRDQFQGNPCTLLIKECEKNKSTSRKRRSSYLPTLEDCYIEGAKKKKKLCKSESHE